MPSPTQTPLLGTDKPPSAWAYWPFFVLGVLNNASYVLMLASATEIASSGIAMVYLVVNLPGLVVKASAPYFFEQVSYRARAVGCGAAMATAFVLVGAAKVIFGHSLVGTLAQFVGVALVSVQCALGEASLLALSARGFVGGPGVRNPRLNMWSSGTGLAGIVGDAWLIVFHTWMGLSFETTLLLALGLAVVYLYVFFKVIAVPPPVLGDGAVGFDAVGAFDGEALGVSEVDDGDAPKRLAPEADAADVASTNTGMTARQRAAFTWSLWPYVVPLILIYFAEYSMQGGAWAAIGFPVTSQEKRSTFYLYANWSYQFGVVISRSSGFYYSPGLKTLWAMPVGQCCLLAFFVADAMPQFMWWYSYSLLPLCGVAGLFGGCVYVNAFRLCSDALPQPLKELGAASLAVSMDIGCTFANVAGLFIQSCLYQANGIPGASATCPFGRRRR